MADEEKTTSQQLLALFSEQKAAADGQKPTSTHDLFTMTQNCIGGHTPSPHATAAPIMSGLPLRASGVGTFGRVRVAEVPSIKGEDGQPVYIAIKIMKKTELVRLKQVARRHVRWERWRCG